MKPSPSAEGGIPGADEIADALRSRGEYVIRMYPQPTQQLVDLHWTAHRAGQLLGIKVRVYVEGPVQGLDPQVTIKVTPRRFDRSRIAAL